MATRYVPPHFRHKAPEPSSEMNDITNNTKDVDLTHRRLADLSLDSPKEDGLYSLGEIGPYFGTDTGHSTLHDSAAKPGEVAYIILFRNANPRWQKDKIIFVHTNIHILPGYKSFSSSNAEKEKSSFTSSPSTGVIEQPLPLGTISSRENFSNSPATTSSNFAVEASTHGDRTETDKTALEQRPRVPQDQEIQETRSENATKDPIPVFSEDAGPKSLQKFRFIGYFRILNIDFLRPHSSELVRMLEQKWTMTNDSSTERAKAQAYTKRRNADRWAEILRQEWAVLKLEEIADSGLEIPKIERQGES